MYIRELDGVTYSNNLQVKYFNRLNSPTFTLHSTKDRLFLMPVVIYFPKCSVLPNLFNNRMIFYREFGLIEYWTQQYTDSRSQLQSQKYEKPLPKKLNIKNIIGIVEIYLVLLLLSGLVFIFELLSVKFAILKCFLDYLTY